MCLRELGVNQCLVKVEHQGLPPLEFCRLRRYHSILLWDGLLAESASSLQFHQLLLREIKLSFDKHLGCLGRHLALALVLLRWLRRATILISILDLYLAVVLASLLRR